MPAESPASPAPALFATLRRLNRTVRPIRGRLLLGMLAAVLASLVSLGIPQVIQYLINTSLGPDPAVAAVWTAAGIVLALGVLEAVLIYLRRVFALYPSVGVERGLRVGLFSRLLRLPVAFHDEWGSGQLLSRSMSDLNQVRRFIAFGTLMFVANSVMILAGIALMFRSDVVLALLFVAAAVPIGVVAYWFNRTFTVLSRQAQDQSGDLATTIEQSVHGIRVLKAFGRAPEALDGFTDQAEDLLHTEVSKAGATARFNMAMIVLPEVALGLALLVGLGRVADGATDVGQLSAYFATATLVTGPVRMIGMILGMAVNTRTALDRHDEVMDVPVAIADPESPAPVDPAAVRGRVELEGVGFRYDDAPPDHPPVLAHVDLTVEPGETLALVGVTGSGKSTLLQLIPRLYDPTSGTVRIDGTDVRDLRLDDLHRLTAFAFEDATLFSSSVRDNVLLGVDDAAEDGDRLLGTALHTADAEFVAELPDGVETRIGEQGLSLSGGQRQRLALARAIAARPAVLLLDDPLSALDTRTEETVTARLREVLVGTTTLIVAHRTSTVALADRVALLDEGRITAVGTHTELMATNPRYRWVIAYLAEEHARNRDLTAMEDTLGTDLSSEPAGGAQ